MTWTTAELAAIAQADELSIAPAERNRQLRPPVPVWVVRDGDELYVRSWRGAGGAWFRAAVTSGNGRVTAGGVTKDVRFVPASEGPLNTRLDAAYRSKYERYGDGYVGPMTGEPARSTTLRLAPE